ncbi:hypothetical protein [Nonomuraea pusilla]|uniref:Uncharacterized protein n=1 Tax=Nonomuraea pusilla TaxID=46177 RepID=A0A1H8JXZ8_9ACTN|nr:hypothetical protein [Nonomuraea pusilla]SEN85570.1 hypothetical protein SAMN05660976_08470 [Nonomuraea pusilla]
MAGKGKGHIAKGRHDVYDTLAPKLGKQRAAQIANAGATKAGRTAMARKAAATRKAHSK